MEGLGFRDRELFNLALLVRQAWRVLQDPSSLSARILKAFCLPGIDFLTAELGSRPSQIWRAVLEGRDILKQGIIRRIGNGQSTNIWDHNWIPKQGSLWPIVSLVHDPPQLVSDLLLPAMASRNEMLIRSMFLPTDAKAIMKIPVCMSNIDAFWAWHPEKKGRFTVSSTYKVMIKTKITRENWLEGRSGSSSNDREDKDWTKLWSLMVP